LIGLIGKSMLKPVDGVFIVKVEVSHLELNDNCIISAMQQGLKMLFSLKFCFIDLLKCWCLPSGAKLNPASVTSLWKQEICLRF
jgi:hypothetical protein